MVVVSFYTQNWLYPKFADELRKACDKLGLQHDIRQLQPVGEWIQNTTIKASFIRTMLDKHDHILWLDVDGTLQNIPQLAIDQEVDFMACKHQTMPREWHVGVMSFKSNERTRQLVDLWVEDIKVHKSTDEASFDRVWGKVNMTSRTFPKNYHVITIDNTIKSSDVYILGISKDESKMKMKERLNKEGLEG